MKNKFINKNDFIVIAVILTISIASIILYNIFAANGALAEIYVDNTLVQTVNLSEDKIFKLDDRLNVILEVKDGAIAFKESDCPDKICVNTGFIKLDQQSATCLPNHIHIKIVGN